MKTLNAKTVLITGGSEGVGAEAAKLFWQHGANVVIAARRKEPLETMRSCLENMPASSIKQKVLTVSCDIGQAEHRARLVTTIANELGHLHVLVNNAAFNQRGDFSQLTEADLDQMIDVNIKGSFQLTRQAIPLLQESATSAENTSIVNVASLAGVYPMPGEAAYSSTKFAMRALSMASRQELSTKNIAVSLVSPGAIKTNFLLDAIHEVPDYVFSQPVSSAQTVAEAIISAALSGKEEMMVPKMSGRLALIGYLFPSLNRTLQPLLNKQGKKAKQRLIEEASS